MKDLVKALVGTLVSQLEDIEKEVESAALLSQGSTEIGEEAGYLQQQIKELKQRLVDVIDDTVA
ncbi:MAG: hypothetical protein ACOX0F_03505 [Syntrophomonadaceae bacterium]